MSAPKYCDDPDNCAYSDCPTAFCDRNAVAPATAKPMKGTMWPRINGFTAIAFKTRGHKRSRLEVFRAYVKLNKGNMTWTRDVMELLASSMECMKDKWLSRAANASVGSNEEQACLDAANDFYKFERSVRRSLDNLEVNRGKNNKPKGNMKKTLGLIAVVGTIAISALAHEWQCPLLHHHCWPSTSVCVIHLRNPHCVPPPVPHNPPTVTEPHLPQ